MKLLNLAQRMESHERYEANKAINTLISQSFRASVQRFTINEITCKPLKKMISTISSPFFVNLTTSIPCGDLEYASTTLKDAGCAVFCFHQGLSTRRIYTDLEDLSNEIAKKGYYEPTHTGTYHSLFDHFGLRRVSNYIEIIDALLRGSISTCLVINALYHNDSNRLGKHFVNIVGIDKSTVFIDDPSCGRITKDFKAFLEYIEIAWVW